jgi:hypothetical protein
MKMVFRLGLGSPPCTILDSRPVLHNVKENV